MAEERNLGLARAEERNLGPARAPEGGAEADATKAELQRRMDEARESISQTVTEIKETVVNQYQQVRETISETLDWREQYRRHTLPLTIGALAVGAVVALIGFALANVAVAFFIANFFGNDSAGAVAQKFGPTSYGLGFLITGVVYLIVGLAIVLVMKSRLANYNPAPTTTIEEIRKDKQWLKNEI